MSGTILPRSIQVLMAARLMTHKDQHLAILNHCLIQSYF